MKAKSLPIAGLVSLLAATSALAADGYGKAERGDGTPHGRVVVSDRVEAMSFYDYFLNNPGKSRTLRFDPGEYYKGLTREYDRP
ncbi:hypothetical protein [Shinella sp.]|uniref:hypothetical protein n=1 Tax=Shinella sp. TaxID=1870904 RepID=UPI0029A03A52|nr:hypothetical protein [Shinella sp.]MDX3977227.1 hypothetical protein [Shinella sp.]